MAAKVIRAFRHANTGRTWLAGELFDGSATQAAELARLGFVSVEPDVAEPEGWPDVAEQEGEPDVAEQEGGPDVAEPDVAEPEGDQPAKQKPATRKRAAKPKGE